MAKNGKNVRHVVGVGRKFFRVLHGVQLTRAITVGQTESFLGSRWGMAAGKSGNFSSDGEACSRARLPTGRGPAGRHGLALQWRISKTRGGAEMNLTARAQFETPT